MKEILSDVERWRAGGQKVAVATVVATRRSAPVRRPRSAPRSPTAWLPPTPAA